MLPFVFRGVAVWAVAAALFGCAGAAAADPPVYELYLQSPPDAPWQFSQAPNSALVVQRPAEVAPAPQYGFANPVQLPKPSDYYIGLGCSAAPDLLRSHLGLKDGQGLVIDQVLPGSPAANAKLQRFDVLVKAGDKPLGAVADLVAAVDAAKDKTLVLELFRQGKSMRVEVKPARRHLETTLRLPGMPPAAELRGRVDAGAAKVEEEFRKALEEARKAGQALPNIIISEWQPGIMLPPGSPNVAALPGNMSISVTKTGNEPAKIVVSRGEQKWEVTEKELDKLPADVRPMVERTLGGLTARGHGAARLFTAPSHAAPPVVQHVVPAPPAAPHKQPEDLQKKLDQLDQKIDQLRKSLDELRSQGGHGKVEKK